MGGQGVADLPPGRAEDQQGQADHGDQRGDTAAGLQEQGGDREGAFELAVAAFDGQLALVSGARPLLAWPGRLQVGRQGVLAAAAASASIAAWPECYDSTGLPTALRVIVVRRYALTRRWAAIAVTRAATAAGVG